MLYSHFAILTFSDFISLRFGRLALLAARITDVTCFVESNMELAEQIEVLEDIGFQFRDRAIIQQALNIYKWWEYFNDPFVLLVERVCSGATCSQSRICDNAVSWDLKHLRFDKWFESVAEEMATLSGNKRRFRINRIRTDQDADVWTMQFDLESKRCSKMFEISTRYPHKYAPSNIVDKIAECFESDSHLFVSFREEYDPVVCWLPREKLSKLDKILPGKFRPITQSAG